MTKFLHSRYFAIAAAFITAACGVAYLFFGIQIPIKGMEGVVGAWSGPWHMPAWQNLWLSIGANCLVAFATAQLIKAYNVLRSMSMLPCGLFLIMQAATPMALICLDPGTLMALAAIVCFALMYATYSQPLNCQRNVFLAFFLPSLGAAIDASFLLLVPVLWLGCGQMRILSLRTFLASFMGLATPWIILLGFGLASPAMLAIPDFYDFSALENAQLLSSLIGIASITIFIGIGAWIQNVMKVLSYNAQSRAMLSMLTVTLLVAIAAIVADFANVYSFLPLLNCMAAMQLGHLFGVIYTQRRSYMAIVLIVLIYLGIFAWRLAMQ